MDVNERPILFAKLYRGLAFIITLCVILPQHAICMSTVVVDSKECVSTLISDIACGNSELVVQSFDHLETEAQSSSNPLDVSRKFLESFLRELNEKYNLTLSTREACVLVRENIHVLQLSQKEQDSLLKTIKLYENELMDKSEQSVAEISRVATVSAAINWHWIWGSPTKDKKKNLQQNQNLSCVVLATQPLGSHEELPPNVYIGGAEILAGALTCIIGTVFPPAYAVGVGLMMDGTRRICNDLSDLDKMRRTKDQFSSPGSFDF